MGKQLIKKIDEHASLYRDPKNGLAWVEDGSTGLGFSCHANIDETGSVEGMRAQRYWGKSDRVVSSHGFIYNIDTYVVDPKIPYEQIAADACMCAACRACAPHAGKEEKGVDECRRVLLRLFVCLCIRLPPRFR